MNRIAGVPPYHHHQHDRGEKDVQRSVGMLCRGVCASKRLRKHDISCSIGEQRALKREGERESEK